jgi:uncharacterized membrane protein HdeD (DUF308 family)
MPPGEAVTMVTDYVLAAFAFGAASWLWREAQGRPGRYWAAAFAASGVAAVLGGTSHGYAPPVLHPRTHAVVWRLTYVTVEVANLCILYGAALATFSPRLHRLALGALVLRLAVVSAALVFLAQMRYVVLDYAITLAGIVGLAATLAARRQAGWGWIVAGTAVSLAAGVVQIARIGQGGVFNHNDVFHLLQAAGLVFYARGGRDLVRRGPSW